MRYLWRGIRYRISLCCIMFFESGWPSIKRENGEYGELMCELTGNRGVILCPDCLARRLGATTKG